MTQFQIWGVIIGVASTMVISTGDLVLRKLFGIGAQAPQKKNTETEPEPALDKDDKKENLLPA